MTVAAEVIAEAVPRLEEEPSPARIEAFSDAVFAIVITLLALDLRVPREDALGGQSLGAALMRQWPLYAAYVLSFLQVGVVWSNHHTMFHYIRRSDHVLLVLNLLLLLCVAVLPFTTAMLAEYARAGHEERQLAAMVYSGALCAAGLFFSAMWQHALHAGLVSPRADPHRMEALRRHWMLLPLLYGLAFVIAWLDARLSIAIYIILLLYYALPGPSVVRWQTRRGARLAALR
ncbi:TMEM175 family protein [Methylorubrum extorquens]|uniref:DUF1211 domain-containing protein n=1 Tax=Methylorubrum extorquens DSM 13060 TaxID=882800 RepID=H1KLF0_METEX|nr:TMEM175 family protein [Methylorubrum extorquens]EHP91635.1 protein of unknown function DUF1211 [Methylorubrum extorquens DSM 13060]